MAPVENNVAKKDKQQIAAMKAKKLSLKKRKACIKKKTRELSVLCDIEACVVIVDDNGEVQTWPENQSAVMNIITRYQNFVKAEAAAGDDKDENTTGHQDLQEAQNQNNVLNLHSWVDPLIDGLPSSSLQEVLGAVDSILEAMGKRIQGLNMVDHDHSNNKGKEIVVFSEPSEQNITPTPVATFPGSMCLSGGNYLNQQQIIEADPNFGGNYLNQPQIIEVDPNFGRNYLNQQQIIEVDPNFGADYLNQQQIMEADPNFGWFNDGSSSSCFNNISGSSSSIDVALNNNQGFLNTMQAPPCFIEQDSNQFHFNMGPRMYPPPQYTTRGLFPTQNSNGVWQNPTGCPDNGNQIQPTHPPTGQYHSFHQF